MKYIDKYPNMKPMEYADNCILVSDKNQGCLICGEPTTFIEVCSEAYFCSDECMNSFYEELEKHCNKKYINEF